MRKFAAFAVAFVVAIGIGLVTIALVEWMGPGAHDEDSHTHEGQSVTLTTVADTTTTTSAPVTTTSLYVPSVLEADVVVVGDSIAGAGAVQGALENGLSVIWVAETGYVGGQASAAGVSSMDEQDGGSRMTSRDVWPYSGLVDAYRDPRHGPGGEYGLPYYGRDNPRSNFNAFGPTALEVRSYLEGVTQAPIEFEVADVLQSPNGAYGVIAPNGDSLLGQVVDATEWQDLYSLVEGIDWVVPACIQNYTWTAVRHVDSQVHPPFDAPLALGEVHGTEMIEGWLEDMGSLVQLDGKDFTFWSEFGQRPWSPRKEWGYREVAWGYSHVNNNATDHPMSPEVITDLEARERLLLEAKGRVYLYLWYQHYELGLEGQGIATDLGYDEVAQLYDHPAIPDEFEQHFAPLPYVRQGRTLAEPVATWEDLIGRHRDDPISEVDEGQFVWGYMADSHGCGAGERSSSYGDFVVDVEWLRSSVPGFWAGMLRGGRVDEVVASSVRMQPSEYIGGYLVSELIAKEG